jgi:hypothetical protein
LEALRRKVIASFAAVVLFGLLGFPVVANAALWISAALPRADGLTIPQSENMLGSSKGQSTLVMLGFALFMSWNLLVAVRAGPDWHSGRPTDSVRLSRRVVIYGSLLSIAGTLVAWLLLLAQPG